MIIDYGSSSSSLLAFRDRRDGPEADLVDWFLEARPMKAPRRHAEAIFREPLLQSTYPDIVIVHWNRDATASYPEARGNVGSDGFRLVQLLLEVGPKNADELASYLGDAARLKSLLKLEAAGLLHKKGDRWHAVAPRRSLAARKIIAVEAKIRDVARAIDQAWLNSWFATSSYILLPRRPTNTSVLAEAKRRGVGIWTRADGQVLAPVEPRLSATPSYVSWLLDDAIWRAARSRCEI